MSVSIINIFCSFPLHFIEMENKQSKGLNDWEWDVYLGQMQLEFREVSSGEQLAFENGESILRFRSRNGSEVSYEKENSRLIRKVNRREGSCFTKYWNSFLQTNTSCTHYKCKRY